MNSAEPTDHALRFLVEKMGEGKLCPVIGAGAGVDRGGPDWRQLIEDLCAKSSWRSDREKAAAAAGGEGGDASQVLPRDADPMHYYDLLRFDQGMVRRLCEVLYEPTSIEEREKKYRERSIENWPRRRPPAGRPESTNELLGILACLVALIEPRRRFHAITYNLDVHLEREILSLGHRPVVSVVDPELGPIELSWQSAAGQREPRVGTLGKRAEVRIFHPHGVLFPSDLQLRISKVEKASRFQPTERRKPLSREEVERLQVPGDSTGVRHFGMVLGRFDYNELFGSLNDPRNLEQLAAFSRLNCLFYGVSFKDPNVDRLLEVASKLLASSLPQPDPDSVEPVLRHVALRRAEDGTQLGRPRALDWNRADEVDFREQQRIAGQWVHRIGHASFEQHRRFVIELIRRLCRELGYYWPGSWSPNLRNRWGPLA